MGSLVLSGRFRGLLAGMSDTKADCTLIALSWLLFLVSILALNILGAPVGFNVWPTGEERVWMELMQKSMGIGIAHDFWQINDRNPVSPWWYVSFRPLLLYVENGFLFARYFMSLLCAWATYLCFMEVTQGRARSTALVIGIFCAVFMANGYIDSIYWYMIGALAASLMSVWAYMRFINGGRREVSWYGLSLVLWFFAFSSYTIQTGAVIAVLYLSIVNSTALKPQETWRRAVLDALPYIGIFCIFLLVWLTTARPEMYEYYRLRPSFIQALSTLRYAIWHPDFTNFITWSASVIFSPAGFVVFGAVLVLVGSGVYADLGLARRTSPLAPKRADALHIAAVTVALMLPTMALEASSTTWFPSTRWRMVHQLWVPAYLGAIVMLFAVLARHFLSEQRAKVVWSAAVGAVAAFLIAVGAGHNIQQIRLTNAEKRVFEGIASVVDRNSQIKHFIIKLSPESGWKSFDTLSPTYMSTWFPGKNLTLRFVQPGGTSGEFASWWTVNFLPDAVGVSNVAIGGSPPVPYAHTAVLSFDGQDVRSLDGAGAEVFEGLNVNWQRTSPLPSK
jgi:hypothetical protein